MLRLQSHLIRIVVGCAALVLSATLLQASDAAQTEARALLDKAEQLSRLGTKGAAPFIFQATIHYGEAPQNAPATFFLVWADEDHWRATAVQAGAREVYVRNSEGLWLPRLPDLALTPVFHEMAFPIRQALLGPSETIEGLHPRKFDGQTLSCVSVRGKNFLRELCVDSTSGLLQRWSIRRKGSSSEIVTELRDYVKAGERWFPREIRRTINGRLLSDLRLVRLAFEVPSSDLFVSPPDYEPWPDCEQYQRPSIPSFHMPLSVLVGDRVADAILIKVGADGKPQDVRLINPTGKNGKEWVDLYARQHYGPATCAGKPVLGYILMHLLQTREDLFRPDPFFVW